MLLLLFVLIVTLLLSVFCTGLLRRYALTRLLDHPNHRSSHQVPTPRGGGMAIVATFLLGAPLLIAFLPSVSALPFQKLIVLWLAAFGIAVVGFVDDHISLRASTRLLVQGAAAAGVVWATSGLPVVTLLGMDLDLSWGGYLLAWVGAIWMVNLYNFMDGIDGLAAGEAAVVCLFMALFHYLDSGVWDSGALALLLCAAVAGFLCWNFPPARIFMGDGGSGFLGLTLATLMLLDAGQQPHYLWAWLVMLGVFVVDATWTLLNRFRHHCRLSEAHCTHGYQYAVKRMGGHRTVTLIVLLINGLWLAPIAAMIVGGYLDGLIGLLIAYLPLGALAYHLNAGVPK